MMLENLRVVGISAIEEVSSIVLAPAGSIAVPPLRCQLRRFKIPASPMSPVW
jgi:hypothetical protein